MEIWADGSSPPPKLYYNPRKPSEILKQLSIQIEKPF